MLKLLIFPLRLLVGYGLSPRILGWVGVAMLVLLRLTIGWHFYSEGLDKYRDGKWDASPFFANARGPFAEHYRQLVWDHDGEMRLNKEETQIWWAMYRDEIGEHYGFDNEQKLQAQINYAAAVEQYDWVIEENAGDLEEYQLGRERMEKLDNDPMRDKVSSLGGQRDTIRREWTQKLTPVLKQIDQIWVNYETAQKSILTPEQSNFGPVPLGQPQLEPMDTHIINSIVPYFDMAIGICLLLGLFTPVAALAAAGFLGSVFLSQYPPTTGPSSTMYQLIECMACLVLAGTGAGRFAGLDFFLHLIVRKTYAPNPR